MASSGIKMDSQQKAGAIIVAAGRSRRMGGVDKVFTLLGGKPILVRVRDVFEKCNLIDEIVVVVSEQSLDRCQQLVAEQGWSKVSEVSVLVAGGVRIQWSLDLADLVIVIG